MNLIKQVYYYLFYKFYRFFEFDLFSAWWSDSKASIYMDALVFFIIIPIVLYYNILVDRYLDVYAIQIGVVLIMFIIMVFNYYVFDYKKKWKKIVKEFDQLPKKKNKIGSLLVVLFICFVLGNFIFSFYLMSQVDWSQYR